MLRRLKRIIAYGMIMLLSFNLSGCGLAASTGLSENEEELVAEYAAGVLMRYIADKKGGLGNPRPTPAPIIAPPADEMGTSEDTEDTEDITSSDDTFDDELTDTDSAADLPEDMASGIAVPDKGLAETLELEGFDVEYTGYEVADIYPPSEDGVLAFSMQAEEGKQLLVLHFDVTNTSSEDKLCDVLNKNVKFRITVNGGSRINEQMTILLNDLKSYSDTVPAGQKVDTVLVFEVAPSVTEQISSLSLIMVGMDGESTFNLF
ncbi:MAG: DUF5067 domain-containing protein [Lachnospiraceae bacterium]|nr:DUF5067 domain-containing protein [Lachnospiraceae bacterium]